MIQDIITKKRCNSCGKILEEKWDFCPYCKDKQIKIKCISCKNDLDPSWNYCPYCTNKKNNNSRDEVLESGNDWLNKILKK